MKTNAVTVTISTYNTAADTWTHRAEIWTRGDLGPGGLHTVITPAGDVCTVSHSGRVFVGAVRSKLGIGRISGEGVRLAA